jgi:hypothetical protein
MQPKVVADKETLPSTDCTTTGSKILVSVQFKRMTGHTIRRIVNWMGDTRRKA